MTMRAPVLVACLALTASALHADMPTPAGPDSFGTVSFLEDGGRVYLPESGAAGGAMLTLLLPETDGAVHLLRARLGAALAGEEDPSGEGRIVFALDLEAPRGTTTGETLSGLVGLALPGAMPMVTLDRDGARLDADGDGQDETLRLCLTSEGLRLGLLPSGADRTGAAALWLAYHPLPYDTEANCDEAPAALRP